MDLVPRPRDVTDAHWQTLGHQPTLAPPYVVVVVVTFFGHMLQCRTASQLDAHSNGQAWAVTWLSRQPAQQK
ncbi:hypothetical protein BH23ACT10_BH23ACT10_28220 [soil metagenome]